MAAIIGAVLAIALMTSGVYTVGQRVTGRGRAALDRIRTANERRTAPTKADTTDKPAKASSTKPAKTSGTSKPSAQAVAVTPAPWAIRAGAGVGAAVQASILTARAGRAGWKVGWESGRNRVLDWYRRHNPTANPAQEETTPPADTVKPEQATAAPSPTSTATGAATPAPAPAQTPDPNSNVVPIRPKGNTTMSINTTTGGEVTTVESALAEAKAMLTEATTELEDATADKNRALQDATRVEAYAASFTANLKMPQRGQDLVAQLAQSNSIRREAAEKRASAAESRENQARRLVEFLSKHVQIGEMAASVGGAADQKAYN